MATINFQARSKDNKTGVIYLVYQDAGRRFLVSTGERTLLKHWDAKKQRVRASAPAAVELNALLDKLYENTLRAQRECKANDKLLDKDILLAYMFPSQTQTPNVKALSALDVYARFMQAIESTRKGGTMKHYASVQNNLQDYQKANGALALAAMDANFIENFVKFCLETYHNNNVTLAKKARTVMAFLNWALRNDYGVNTKYKEYRFRLRNNPQRKTHLTYEELMRIYETPVKESERFYAMGELNENKYGRLEKARDVFCFACFTGLRFSDIKTFRKELIVDGALIFHDQKTGEQNFLPLTKAALAILEKHNYQLPVVSSQKTNEYIKEICKRAGVNSKVVSVTFKGAQRVEQTVEKWQTISMHTARRTFIALSLQLGIRLEVVQALVGHNDVRTTLQYVDINEGIKRQEMEKWH